MTGVLSSDGVDGRLPVLGLTLAFPAVLLGVTLEWFGANPVAVLVLFATMLLGSLYYTTYLGPRSSPV